MFISEEEAHKRLKSTDNLLARIANRGGASPSPILEEVIPCSVPSPSTESSEEEPGTDSKPDPGLDEDIDGNDIPVNAFVNSVSRMDSQGPELLQNVILGTEERETRQAELEDRREEKHKTQRGGRYSNQKNIPPIFRELIGTAARVGSLRGAAHVYGTSVPHACHLKHGRTGPLSQTDVNPSLLQQIEDNTNTIRKNVLDKMTLWITGITEDKLTNKDAKELSVIARNLASIMQATKPPADSGDKTTNAQVIVFAPELGKEVDYETVEVG